MTGMHHLTRATGAEHRCEGEGETATGPVQSTIPEILGWCQRHLGRPRERERLRANDTVRVIDAHDVCTFGRG
jgi:hypothetical protein